jgi:hypothetical protein
LGGQALSTDDVVADIAGDQFDTAFDGHVDAIEIFDEQLIVPRTAIDQVVVAENKQIVVSGTAGEVIYPKSAEQLVVTVPAVERVVAGRAKEGVVIFEA